MVDRIPPHDIDAEEAFLGSILLDAPVVMSKNINRITPVDFYSDRNRWIYEACLSLYERLERINEVTLGQELSRIEKLESCGGAAFLCHLICVTPTFLDAEYYADIVHRLSVGRKLIIAAEQIAAIGYQSNPDVNETLTKASDILTTFRNNNAPASKVTTPMMAGNEIIDLFDKYKDPSHAPSWGFWAMDHITGGVYVEYVVIGARPSVGKSQLMLDISEFLSIQGLKILFVSAEMTNEQIYQRKLSRRADISILDLRKYGLRDHQTDSLMTLASEVSQSNHYLLSGGIYLKDIYREASQMLDKGGLGTIFIDYLGALKDCYVENRDNQNVRLSRVSNRIQEMVHEFKVPIIVASQLNRDLERNSSSGFKSPVKSRRPQLSDLGDSGSIEQDADVVFLLHRETEENGDLSSILKVRMAKNRQLGPHKSIELLYNHQLHRYTDYSNHEEGN
jgi:replicative DNA helicase